MEIFRIKNLTFTYPQKEKKALNNISLDIERGEFLVLMGESGSGKSTLLRNLKPAIAPSGEKEGDILFNEKDIEELIPLEKLDARSQASNIGYVLQNPDNQIVTDKVWHELAFGLENLGLENSTIRMRVSEMANFFGIQTWFEKNTKELSGGQKQILNLASVMVMKPDVLILDEPTAQLDPIAATEFIQVIRKINREIGTTIIMSEHRLDEVLTMADRVVVIEEGEIIADDSPENVGRILLDKKNNMFTAMPAPMQAFSMVYEKGYGRGLNCPIDVRGGRLWLNKILKDVKIENSYIEEKEEHLENKENVLEIKDVWFRYAKKEKDVIKGLDLDVKEGEILAIVGGNGTGKTTTLNLLAGIKKAYRGKVNIFGKNINKYENEELRRGLLGMLPQDPQSIFVADNVKDDLLEILIGQELSEEEKEKRIHNISKLIEIESLLNSHPYDISGGEQQRVALAKILLLNPKIILLDEPTKGIDNFFKEKLGEILIKLRDENKTVILVSHDIEFAGRYADRCAMMFEGKITAEGRAREFFSGNSFYTTSANKMSSHIYKNAVTAKDVGELTIENLEKSGNKKILTDENISQEKDNKNRIDENEIEDSDKKENKTQQKNVAENKICQNNNLQYNTSEVMGLEKHKRKYNLMILIATIGIVGAIAGSIVLGMESSFYLTSILIIIFVMMPFMFSFEKSRPTARELVLISVIIGLAVAGRAAFFLVPQVKPIIAVIIAGSFCIGPNSGFVIGAMSAFVSNFLFGQGPWTPWQMLAMGTIGFIAGMIGKKMREKEMYKKSEKKRKLWMAILGGIGTFFIYGLLVDIWTIFGFGEVSIQSILLIYMAAIPFNLVLAISTGIFLLLFSNPMISKIERIKLKYGFEVWR